MVTKRKITSFKRMQVLCACLALLGIHHKARKTPRGAYILEVYGDDN